jgi:pyroglutamyl-peptidase
LSADVLRVLIAGFGPFPGAPSNPSAALVKALARRKRPAFAGVQLLPHVFKTTYEEVDRQLPGLFAVKPDIILMFGLATRRRHLCIETQARNAVSVLFPDASGYRPQRNVIVRGGKAQSGGAPFADLLGALRGSSIPARLSRDAGRYLCNYVYWRTLERAQQERTLVQFVHIPPVRFCPQPRKRDRRRSVSFRPLVAAAETLLIALIAARRRGCS